MRRDSAERRERAGERAPARWGWWAGFSEPTSALLLFTPGCGNVPCCACPRRGLGQSLGPVAPSGDGRSSPDSAAPAGGAATTQEFLTDTWNFWGDKVPSRSRVCVLFPYVQCHCGARHHPGNWLACGHGDQCPAHAQARGTGTCEWDPLHG